ncbi:putative stress-related vesicular transport protein [Scheffersomyces stipitis CBS 6054]|uniref:Protein SEY1 n=1 Tax=Scheffersomyces stipitis (strain ATCC 58785 / CBS 6054 / NBRC 10063 / NRRL Y-11545) TaxID=322104 RepID=SEY1_PICST|nr:putative stress-related vesicular transport protein [Scheffersomyces stipitis CBS 6054]A3LWM9.2 RecName: Full=Protein SEY1 [Scheffersomyces stipitis CBS 6054]ABN67661.2 putative stress-related vesicular transport protein [Scheffersomyces stipitis CBS 6054]
MSQSSPSNAETDEDLSTTSSSSSFVPIEQHQIQDAIQVIDENKEFNKNILPYVVKTTPISSVGNNYHIISVFGSQSTGKSTLLNRLFNTNFDVMDESRRQQTTKGIWMAHSPQVSTTKQMDTHQENIFVMDVEGTDGRERGEDQDFERKAALFALATSEILIVNIWETQIGLYQGANMGLLKTVFEVNLTLFGKSKLEKNDHKVLLLIVIRDHVGLTPKENLSSTITQDLLKIWESLNKPAELAHLQFEDFFDTDFHTLRHKVLQPKEFLEDVNELGDRLVVKKDLFRPNYHHNIPIDGWTMYAENCWQQIDSNKDLDLPTQQILVAKFKCDEISASVYEEFHQKFKAISSANTPGISTLDYQDLGLLLVDLRSDTLENYDLSASRYTKSVYEQRKDLLKEKLNEKFREFFDAHIKHLSEKSVKEFETNIVGLKGKNFDKEATRLTRETTDYFINSAILLSLENELDYDVHVSNLQDQLTKLIQQQQLVELKNIVNKSIKKLSSGLTKAVSFELADPTETSWNNILSKFKEFVLDFLSKNELEEEAGTYDFGLGTNRAQNKEAVETFKFKSWNAFYEIIHKIISKDNLLTLLKDRFDDKFRYDENGLPRMYQNTVELETNFGISKSFALRIVPLLTIAKLNDNSEILPDYDIFDSKLRAKYLGLVENEHDSEDEEDEEDRCFAEIISESEKAEVLNKFKKETDARFIETKRSIVQHVTQIPYYIYLVIMVLGWNEFMAIVRNPLFFSLVLVFGAGLYILYSMNLLKPAMVVVQRLIDEIIAMAKEKMREFLIDDHPTQAHNLQKISASNREKVEEEKVVETIEMQDL